MGIHAIKMPDIGEGIAEVELVGWHVKEGDTVAEDQILADVMTDKANVEIPSPVAGKVVWLGGTVGTSMAVGSELIRLEVEGAGNVRESGVAPRADATVSASQSSPTAQSATPTQTAARPTSTGAPTPTSPPGGAPIVDVTNTAGAVAMGGPSLSQSASKPSAPAGATTMGSRPAVPQPGSFTPASNHVRQPGDRPIASPAVRRHAWDHGIELHFVHGSGPGGRILHEDIEAFIARKGAVAAGDAGAARDGGRAAAGGGAAADDGAQASSTSASRYVQRNDSEQLPVIGLRRRIAQKMQEAKRRIPHFTYVEEIDVTEVEALRAKLNERWAKERGKLTMLPLIARAMVVALRDFPQVNATYDDDGEGGGTVTRHGAVHLGVAAQTDGGLLVPVVRHAEAMDVWAIGAEIARLAEAARTGKASREELSGSTITLTSLGALGGIVSTPVINHPEVAIVGVNRMVEKPVVRSGAIVVRLTMNLSSSFDHRIVDGMDAARFIQQIRALLESPAMLFID